MPNGRQLTQVTWIPCIIKLLILFYLVFIKMGPWKGCLREKTTLAP